MLSAPVLLFLLLTQQSTASCADVSACRAAALDAQARKDFESFHDLAWLTYRKGKQDDPELMLLLARAQSLSGRPTDALVMLRRVMARGVPTDAATSEDFARVRALPGWKELFGDASSPEARAPSPDTSATAKATADKPSDKPADKSPKPSDKSAKPGTPGPPTTPSTLGTSAPTPRTAKRAPGAPVTFTTLLKPTALAYDAVSGRYLIADRDARRVAVVDENSGHVSTLVGTQAALGDIGGVAIDSQQGDLWVVSTTPEGTVLHRLQLISGRVISTTPITGLKAPFVGLTYVRGGGLVAADSSGNVWRVTARGQLERLAELEYGPRAIASDAAGRIYVSAGGSRLARFATGPRAGSREVLTLPDDGIVDGGMAIVGERLHFVAPRDGSYEIRTIPLKR